MTTVLAEDIAGGAHVEQAAQRLLDQFGLTPYAERAAALLPEGVRKLLDVAMALVAKPRVLLLDEPTSGVAADREVRHHGPRDERCARRRG